MNQKYPILQSSIDVAETGMLPDYRTSRYSRLPNLVSRLANSTVLNKPVHFLSTLAVVSSISMTNGDANLGYIDTLYYHLVVRVLDSENRGEMRISRGAQLWAYFTSVWVLDGSLQSGPQGHNIALSKAASDGHGLMKPRKEHMQIWLACKAVSRIWICWTAQVPSLTEWNGIDTLGRSIRTIKDYHIRFVCLGY